MYYDNLMFIIFTYMYVCMCIQLRLTSIYIYIQSFWDLNFRSQNVQRAYLCAVTDLELSKTNQDKGRPFVGASQRLDTRWRQLSGTLSVSTNK